MLGESNPLGINTDKRGGVPLLMGTAPALAKGTASIGPTGKAKIATTAEPKALAPWAQDKARHEHEVDVPPQEVLL